MGMGLLDLPFDHGSPPRPALAYGERTPRCRVSVHLAGERRRCLLRLHRKASERASRLRVHLLVIFATSAREASRTACPRELAWSLPTCQVRQPCAPITVRI